MVQGVVVDDGFIVDRNPATGDILGRIPVTSQCELETIISNANEAKQAWAGTLLERRIKLLFEACQKLSACVDVLATKITEEMGKPIQEAKTEALGAADKGSFLELMKNSNEDEVLEGEDGSKSVVIRDPLGVVAVLSPWNFPADEILLLALPALAAGNCVIVKPSEVTPLVGQMVVDTIKSVLPPGVLQIVQGDGKVGQWLVESDGINMVAMTGSTAVGRSIMSACAPKLKRLVLELGGKDPMVVFQDADLDVAANDAVQHSLENTGQVCCSIERVYVDESIREDFEKRVVDIASKWKVGNGMDKNNKVGPLVSTMQRERVAQQVNLAVKQGAKVLYKSLVPDPAPEETSFYPVTVLSNVNQGMDIQRLETFGPVIALSSFSGTETDGVKLANDTEYGLASCVYTTDLSKAQRVARQIRSGQVGINCYSLDNANESCPWVGHKCSGFGYHSGADGFRQFSVPKSLVFAPLTTKPE